MVPLSVSFIAAILGRTWCSREVGGQPRLEKKKAKMTSKYSPYIRVDGRAILTPVVSLCFVQTSNIHRRFGLVLI